MSWTPLLLANIIREHPVSPRYYPSGLFLTTLERNPWLQKHADSIQQKHPNLRLEEALIGNAEKMDMVPDASFDAVVGTHILCCIQNKEAVVKEIHRVLKPVRQGKSVFLVLINVSFFLLHHCMAH